MSFLTFRLFSTCPVGKVGWVGVGQGPPSAVRLITEQKSKSKLRWTLRIPACLVLCPDPLRREFFKNLVWNIRPKLGFTQYIYWWIFYELGSHSIFLLFFCVSFADWSECQHLDSKTVFSDKFAQSLEQQVSVLSQSLQLLQIVLKKMHRFSFPSPNSHPSQSLSVMCTDHCT